MSSVCAVLLALGVSSPGKPPEPTKEAQRLARQSMLEYDVGRFEEALQDVTRAYLLDPRPALLFNLGQCHRSLEHWKQAEFFYRNYLHKQPAAPNRAAVLELIDEMVARQHGAGGEAAQHAAAAPGPAPSPTVVALVEAPPQASPAPPAPAVSMPAPVAAEPAPAAAIGEPGPVAAAHRGHTLAWVLGGAALACVAVAVVGTVEWASYQSLLGAANSPNQTSYTQYQQNVASAEAKAPSAQHWQIAAIVTGVAAAAGATGAVFTW